MYWCCWLCAPLCQFAPDWLGQLPGMFKRLALACRCAAQHAPMSGACAHGGASPTQGASTRSGDIKLVLNRTVNCSFWVAWANRRFGVSTGANVSPSGGGHSSDYSPAVKSKRMAGALVPRPAWAWVRRKVPRRAVLGRGERRQGVEVSQGSKATPEVFPFRRRQVGVEGPGSPSCSLPGSA